jgi:hypothetical protein
VLGWEIILLPWLDRSIFQVPTQRRNAKTIVVVINLFDGTHKSVSSVQGFDLSLALCAVVIRVDRPSSVPWPMRQCALQLYHYKKKASQGKENERHKF